MKTITIEIPDGYELDKVNEKTGKIFFRPKKEKYPKNISEIPLPTSSYFITSSWEVCKNNNLPKERTSRSFANLARKKDAEALVTLAKLITLRDEYNRIDGFTLNCCNGQKKYCVKISKNEISIDTFFDFNYILYFGSRETTSIFVDNFKDLIKTAKHLL